MARNKRKPKKKKGRPGIPAASSAELLAQAKQCYLMGDLEKAEAIFRLVLKQNPGSTEALHYLGFVTYQMGDWDRAHELLTQAIERDPAVAIYHLNLGIVFQDTGKFHEAMKCYLNTLELDPDNAIAQNGVANMLEFFEPTSYQPEFEKILEGCYSSPNVDHQKLARMTMSYLNLKYEIVSGAEGQREDRLNHIGTLHSDSLLRPLLERTIITDARWEEILTKIRRTLLHEYSANGEIGASAQKLASSLAQQCFTNEYVYGVEEEEERWLQTLQADIEAGAKGEVSSSLEQSILVFGMYASLHELSCGKWISEVAPGKWSSDLQPLIRRSLWEPMEETRIKERIESIGGINDDTSRAVRAQYEENPYPRWISLPHPNKVTLAYDMKIKFPNISLPPFFSDRVQILVAGCGTGADPLKFAMMYDNVEIVALDLSLSSLGYAVRMGQKLGVQNVRFLQGDILDCSKLDRQFHVILSGGVLHHMEDPAVGWGTLVDILAPGGLMLIGLYSERGRRNIVRARNQIRERGLQGTAPDIRKFREDILRNKKDPLTEDILTMSDFYNMSECRDLLFHVMEHRFTLSQIQEILEINRLKFLGFELSSKEAAESYRERFPEDPEMTRLDLWDRFEEEFPNTFLGMYQFWCQKAGAE